MPLTANTTVADAAKARDAAAVKALLQKGVDVNEAHGDGMTALHWAASHGDAVLAQMLLSAGANIRATTRLGGITALHMASQGGHANVVAALIAAGADANTITSTGATAVMLAARAGSSDTVTRLVETGADVNIKEKAFGQTALMIAAGLDRADVVRLLLAKGADWKAASSVADLKSMTSMMDDGTGRPQQQQRWRWHRRSDERLPLQRVNRHSRRADGAAFCGPAGQRGGGESTGRGRREREPAKPRRPGDAAAGGADQWPLRSRRDAAREAEPIPTW